MDTKTREILKGISTATLTTVLLKKGLRNVWLRGAFPKQPGQKRVAGGAFPPRLLSARGGPGACPKQPGQKRVAGIAFTLRFVPAREDLATPASWASPISTRAAIEAMEEGVIAVADAMGVADAGIFGDILCARMAKRKVGALITDGVMRDMEGVLATGLPVWCAGAAAPASVAGLTFINWQEPIGCGGVAVFPGDTIVADGDGAVVTPQALLAEVVEAAVEQEAQEAWIINEVNSGVPLPGLYPPNDENK